MTTDHDEERKPLDLQELVSMTEREVVLMFGPQASGKSRSVAHLLADLKEQNKQALIIDRGNGMAKALKEVFGKTLPDNFTYYLVKDWRDIEAGMEMAFDILTPSDWLIFEEAGKMWDFIQSEYSRRVYGKSHTMHALDLRAQAERRIGETLDEDLTVEDGKKEKKTIRKSEMGGGGLSIDQDWGWIKQMHNDEVFDRAIIEGLFNVLSTTSAEELGDYDKGPRWADYEYIGAKPGGEKLHVNRHTTVMYVYGDGHDFYWRTDMGGNVGKDRGYSLVKDEPCTGLGAIGGLIAHHAKEDGGD